MLKSVLRALRDARLIGMTTDVRCNVTFKNNGCLFALHCDDGAYYHVKASDSYDYSGEFAANLEAAARFPYLVPFPLGSGSYEGISWIAYEGLRLRPVTRQELSKARAGSPLHDGLMAYATASRRQAELTRNEDTGFIDLSSGLHSHMNVPSHLLERLNALASEPEIAAIPRCMQHGDLAINNVALADGRLAIIDWEDFGKVSLAGFDLAVLAASAVDFDPVQLLRLPPSSSVSQTCAPVWLVNTLRASGLDVSLFTRALPLYLWLFLRLKAPPYSQAVRDRVRNALLAIA